MHPRSGPPSGSASSDSDKTPSPQEPPAAPPQHSESSALLAAIVESSEDAILSKNTEGIITSWNRSAERIFGYSAQEAIGQHITLLAMPGRESEMETILARVLAGEQVTHFETVRRHKDGHPVLVSLTTSPIRNQDGVIIGASKISRDITAQKQREQFLQQSEKLALLGRLSASIAHEINNPLESLTNLLYLLRHQPGSPDRSGYLELAESELARISSIVTQTLAFHNQNSHPHPVDLATLIDSALTFLHYRTHNRALHITRRYRQTQPVLCYEGEIRQVVLHLISNALDAIQQRAPTPLDDQSLHQENPPAGRLGLACRPATDWCTDRSGIRLTIADNGPGISPDDMPHIFEASFTTSGNSGDGLGLWITTEIITRHHGRIRVRSSRQGTVFSIFLPTRHSESSPIPSLSSFSQPL